MFTSHPFDALAAARERAHRFREESAVENLRRASMPGRASSTRRSRAASLRCAANRLDPAPLRHRPA
jgi:hypothetical protein